MDAKRTVFGSPKPVPRPKKDPQRRATAVPTHSPQPFPAPIFGEEPAGGFVKYPKSFLFSEFSPSF
jgi:hypothetical protein